MLLGLPSSSRLSNVSRIAKWGMCANNTVLIVFHCTFIALRAYDGRRQRAIGPLDHDLENEIPYFSASVAQIDFSNVLTILDRYKTTAFTTAFVYFEIEVPMFYVSRRPC